MLRQMLAVFRSSIAGMELEEKRAAIRTVVRKVIWDGVNVHVVLFGGDESEIKLPNMADRMRHVNGDSGEEEPLNALTDGENEEFHGENAVAALKSPWGAGSK